MPLARFAELLTRDQFGLAEACLLIAQDAYPDVDVDSHLAQIESMAERVRARIAPDAFAEQRITALNAFLFGELGYHGNVEAYYDPRNSYLNEVMARRTGIPILLSIVYMELGQRIGLRLQGVSFPGHFLVKLRVTRGQLVLDPFHQGEPQSAKSLRMRLEQVLPRQSRQAGSAASLDLEPYLETATPREIIARVLRNLKAIYLKGGELHNALGVMNRMMLVVPEAAEELRDRAAIYDRLECFRPALADYQNYLRRVPDAADAFDVNERISELQGRVARLN